MSQEENVERLRRLYGEWAKGNLWALRDIADPEIEWDWDDGGKSTHEADCAPYEAGTQIERRFTAQRMAADYVVLYDQRRRQGVGDRRLGHCHNYTTV